MDQPIKSSFMGNFLELIRVYMDDHLVTMRGFIDWLSSK